MIWPGGIKMKGGDGMKVPTEEEIIWDETKKMIKSWPWIKIILILFCLFYFTFFGRIAWGQDTNYVEPTRAETLCEQVNDAYSDFLEDYNRDATDMGITLAQKDLAKRIDSILSRYEMDIDTEKLQADEEEREMDRQGIWKDMTNNN